jgi:hypothetical protein
LPPDRPIRNPGSNAPLLQRAPFAKPIIRRAASPALDKWEKRRAKWSADEAAPFLAKESAIIVKDEEARIGETLDKLLKPFEEAGEKIHDLAEKVETKFEGVFEVIKTFGAWVAEGQKISAFIGQLEVPIRLIFQAISCGFPPAWGCL